MGTSLVFVARCSVSVLIVILDMWVCPYSLSLGALCLLEYLLTSAGVFIYGYILIVCR